jgi:hypothetical protein
MTRRTRSILIDGTLPVGRVFSLTNNTSTATADKLIAGVRPSASTTTIKASGISIAVAIATKGVKFVTNGLITEITYKFSGKDTTAATPSGRVVIVRLRKISSSGTTTNIANYNLPVGVLSGTITTDSITITAGDTFYWDVTQVGSGRPGQGLGITTTYYKS